MRTGFFATIMLIVAVSSCKKPSEEVRSLPEFRPDSWLGIELSERREYGDEIREYPRRVVITGIVPGSPAEGRFNPDDVILDIGGRPVVTPEEVQSSVRRASAGEVLEVRVRRDEKNEVVQVRPEAKPLPEELLTRLFLDKPIPPFGGRISIAEADGNGDIVTGSQCVAEDDEVCPTIGKAGKTDFALGKATVMIFWSQYDRGSPAALETMDRWEQRFGTHGLKVVGVTSDTPGSLPKYLKNGGAHPPMTLVSMYLGDYGLARFAAREQPAVLVLDDKGVVRGIAVGDGDALTELEVKVLPRLLATPQ